MTETGKLAHMVFPACTFAEKDGTVTNHEGQVQFVRPALEPLGESVLDWHVLAGIANTMGQALPYESTGDIQKEIRKMVPGYYNLGQPKKVAINPSAYLQNGYMGEVSKRYAVPSRARKSDRPFGLKMIQLLYHSGKLSTKASGLMDISPNTKCLRMSLEEVERLGLTEGGRVRVTSDQGSLELGIEADLSVMPGCCIFPEHFNEPAVKDLMSAEIDPVTRVPYFKLAYVSIEKV